MPGASARRKGSTFEREVVAYLKANGFPAAERAYGAGRPDDVGDIDGVPGFVLECKNHQRIDLATWMEQVLGAWCRGPHSRPWYACIVKRRGRPVHDAYVVMPLNVFSHYVRRMAWEAGRER